jgi:hypothetical protein
MAKLGRTDKVFSDSPPSIFKRPTGTLRFYRKGKQRRVLGFAYLTEHAMLVRSVV